MAPAPSNISNGEHDASNSPVTLLSAPLSRTVGGGVPIPTWRLGVLYLSLCLGLLLSVMDLTVVTPALYTIAIDFNSLAGSDWVILAYSLAELGFTVLSTHASEFLGRRMTLLISYTLVFAFSLGAGFATSLNQLIAFRACQGIGASGLYALTIIIMIEISVPKMLPLVGGIIGAVVAVSGVLGPIIGGFLTQYVSWRWIFWVTTPISSFALVLFVLALPKDFYQHKKRRRDLLQFDIAGGFLLLAGSVLFVFGLQQGGVGAFAWSDAVIITTLTSGCICWLLLFAWELWLSHTRSKRIVPIFPLSILSRRILAAGILSTLLSSFSFFSVIFLLPLRFQILNHIKPSSVGPHMLPLLVAVGFGSFASSGLSRKLNNNCFTFVAGVALTLLGVGLLSTLASSSLIGQKIYGYQVLLGLGIGMVYATISTMIGTRVEPANQAVIQGIASQARLFGGSIGIAAANAITSRQAKSLLKEKLTTSQIASLQFSTAVVATLTEAQREAVRKVYASAFTETMRLCVYIAVAGIVIGLGTIEETPSKSSVVAKPPVDAQSGDAYHGLVGRQRHRG